MAHFKLKATIDGQESIQEEFTNLTGSKTLKIFPDRQNTSQQTLRGVATVNLSNKTYNIYLTHKGQSSEDPDPSVAKWSYIDPLYSTRDVLVPDETKLSLDTAYVRASCGKSYYDEDEEGYITNIILSKRYDTYQGLLNTVGDFSGNHYGTISDSTSARVLVSFKMFYKAIGDSGVIPVDDGSPESNKARIPAKPEASAAPDWITSGYIRYVIDYISEGINHTMIFVNWDSFIDYWENLIIDPTCDDATFSYEYVGVIQPNNSTKGRDNQTITFNEIDNGKTPGTHGIKPLYLKISQQEGFIKYRLSSVDAPFSCWQIVTTPDGLFTRWSLCDETISQNPLLNLSGLVNKALPENTDSTYGHHCIFSPEFKVHSGNTDPRGVPAKVWTEKGYTLMGDSIWNTLSYQYIGKPIVMGTFRETPSTFEKTQLIPFVYDKVVDSSGSSDSSEHGSFEPTIQTNQISEYSLLGPQCFDLFAYNPDNPSELMFREDAGSYHALDNPYPPGRLLSGIINNKKWVFKLIPVSLLTSSGNLDLSYEGVGMNEIGYFQAGNSAVTSQELVRRAVYAEYHHRSNPSYNSPMTLNGKQFEISFISGYDDDSAYWKKVSQILFIPVLFTDFYLEEVNPFESISNGILGRLFFSIRELGATTDASDLTQLVIKIPKITRI